MKNKLIWNYIIIKLLFLRLKIKLKSNESSEIFPLITKEKRKTISYNIIEIITLLRDKEIPKVQSRVIWGFFGVNPK